MGLVWSWLATVDEKKKISRQIDKEILQVRTIEKEILQVRIIDKEISRILIKRRLKLRFPQELKQEADEIDLLLLGAAESGK